MSDAVLEQSPKSQVINPPEFIDPQKVILDAVNEDKKGVVQEAIMLIQEESFSGPIPSPRVLKEYEILLPGSSDRILKMAEQQQQHRMEIEKKAIGSQLKDNTRGQVFGFIIVLIFVGVSLYFANIGMKTLAGVLLTVTLVTLVSIFVLGKKKSHNDLEEKSEDMEK